MTKTAKIPKALKQGELKFLGNIPVAVLDTPNRDRVVSIRGMANALGVKGGGAYWARKSSDTSDMLPEFVSASYLEPYITDNIQDLLTNTITYTSTSGTTAVGIRAEIIPKICDVWIRAKNGGALHTEKRQAVAEKAYVMLSAFAEVGITALIDEATGYAKDRLEYEAIIAKYVAPELQAWVKTFGEDFYYQIYRLKGWDWKRFVVDRKNHPWAVANITNRIIYEKLPEGVVEALKEQEPMNAKGQRQHRLHQHLTPDDGKVHLLKHLGAVQMIMEKYDDGQWTEALHEIDTRFKSERLGTQLGLGLDKLSGDKRIFDNALSRAAMAEQKEPGK